MLQEWTVPETDKQKGTDCVDGMRRKNKNIKKLVLKMPR
jgi:hypothetical protein